MLQEFNLELTSIPRNLVKDVLRGILHSIFFHRLLVNVIPRELRVLNTTVSITDSPEVENLIEEKIIQLLNSINHPPPVSSSSSSSISQSKQQGKFIKRLGVLFYEKRLRKNWFQFSKSEEFVCWEQWTITLHLLNNSTVSVEEHEQLKVMKSVEHQLKQSLLKILKIVNEYKEHIPSITTTEGNPFPYQIAIQSSTETWTSMVKRLQIADVPTIERSATTTLSSSKKGQQQQQQQQIHQHFPNALPNVSSSTTSNQSSSSNSSRPPSLRSIKR